MTSQLLLIVAVGAAIGFLGGLLGKGGSALATPILVAFGIPPVIALVAPLPATVPGTLVPAGRHTADGVGGRSATRSRGGLRDIRIGRELQLRIVSVGRCGAARAEPDRVLAVGHHNVAAFNPA